MYYIRFVIEWIVRLTCNHSHTVYVLSQKTKTPYTLPHETCDRMYCKGCGKVFFDVDK